MWNDAQQRKVGAYRAKMANAYMLVYDRKQSQPQPNGHGHGLRGGGLDAAATTTAGAAAAPAVAAEADGWVAKVGGEQAGEVDMHTDTDTAHAEGAEGSTPQQQQQRGSGSGQRASTQRSPAPASVPVLGRKASVSHLPETLGDITDMIRWVRTNNTDLARHCSLFSPHPHIPDHPHLHNTLYLKARQCQPLSTLFPVLAEHKHPQI